MAGIPVPGGGFSSPAPERKNGPTDAFLRRQLRLYAGGRNPRAAWRIAAAFQGHIDNLAAKYAFWGDASILGQDKNDVASHLQQALAEKVVPGWRPSMGPPERYVFSWLKKEAKGYCWRLVKKGRREEETIRSHSSDGNRREGVSDEESEDGDGGFLPRNPPPCFSRAPDPRHMAEVRGELERLLKDKAPDSIDVISDLVESGGRASMGKLAASLGVSRVTFWKRKRKAIRILRQAYGRDGITG